jgi:hypothetical protein
MLVRIGDAVSGSAFGNEGITEPGSYKRFVQKDCCPQCLSAIGVSILQIVDLNLHVRGDFVMIFLTIFSHKVLLQSAS